MAIKKQIKVHAEAPPMTAYIVIDHVIHSKVRGSLVLQLMAFRDEGRRRELGHAAHDILWAQPIIANHEQNGELRQESGMSDEDFLLARMRAAAELVKARKRYEAAAWLLQSIPPLGPLDMNLTPAVPVDEIDGLLDAAGNPDRAKCYAWLMAQPGYYGEQV